MPTIVVIEEDMAMRALICEWLAGEGYRVRGLPAARAPREAGVDLVIVNVLNLRAQGADTVRQVQAMYPGAALIGISTQLGRSLSSDSDPARALGVSRLVAKPCTRDELLGAVTAAIGAAH